MDGRTTPQAAGMSALGFTTSRTAMAGVGDGWPPRDLTEAEATAVNRLDKKLKDLLAEYLVAHRTWAALQDAGVTTLWMFADFLHDF